MPLKKKKSSKLVKRGPKRTRKNGPKRKRVVKRKVKREKYESAFGRSAFFGDLQVPSGMRPVSSFRKAGQYNRPYLQMPFGPPQPWLMRGPESGTGSGSAPSSRPVNSFGYNRRRRMRFGNMNNQYLNPSGFLAIEYGQPTVPPPSWNYNLRQGGNIFRQNVNYPGLDRVMV